MAAQATPEPATIEPRHFKSAGDFANAIQMVIDAEEPPPVDIIWTHRFTPVSGRTALSIGQPIAIGRQRHSRSGASQDSTEPSDPIDRVNGPRRTAPQAQRKEPDMSPTQIAPEHPKPEVLVRRLELDAADELGTVVEELVDEVNDRGQTPFSVYARFRESSITVAVIGAPAAAN